MCGVAGWISRNPLSSKILVEMTRMVKHRGPDSEGFAGLSTFEEDLHVWENPPPRSYSLRLALGHRRLSILDLSERGFQPMRSQSGSLSISYNGEIYNYLELRGILEKQGFVFASGTDTEVILAAWEAWGPDCLDRFNGMFAFLLFDQKNGVLHAVRDRFGIKPLYYNASLGFLGFASEIKQFESVPNWKPVLVPQVAYDFLAWGLQDHGSNTFFEGVKQLRPGERLQINIDEFNSSYSYQAQPIKWYDLKKISLANHYNLEQGSERLRVLLSDSVRLRLRSDVPVGSCLSGGLDSSSIVCLIDEERKRNRSSVGQCTFSARAEDALLDEGHWIDAVLKNRSLKPSSVMPVFEDLASELSNLVRIHDEPFGSASIFIQNLVFGLAKKSGVKVVLDGQGADELFGGYDSFRVCAAAGMFRRGNLLSGIRELHSLNMSSGSVARMTMRVLESLVPYEVSAFIRGRVGKKTSGPNWLKFDDHDIKKDHSPAFLGTRASRVRTLSEVQLSETSLPKLLHWEDRNSMAMSVEGRVPFLDHRVVEFALGISSDLKVSGGVTKRVLREAMSGIIPEKIANRTDKIGFAASEREWFLHRNPSWFRRGIEKACEFKGLFSSDLLLRENEKMLEGSKKYDVRMWRVLCFGEWMDRFSVSLPTDYSD